jgi:hypothetical protein
MKNPLRKFGEWGRSPWTNYLEMAVIVLAGLLALRLMERFL